MYHNLYKNLWEDCRNGALRFVRSLQAGGNSYADAQGNKTHERNIRKTDQRKHKGNEFAFYISRYSRDNNGKPLAIASATAALLAGFCDGLHLYSVHEKQQWSDYLLTFQQAKDGMFDDPIDLASPTQDQPEWALRAHRFRHIAWAIETLGGRLKYPVKYVEQFCQGKSAAKWLDNLWQQKWPGGIWAAGNWIMDMGVMLDFQYRHFDDDGARRALDELFDELDKKQDTETGFWYGPGNDLRCGMAGSMHLFPLYWAYRRPLRYFDKSIDSTLKLQQKDGLFGYKVGCGGSQCLDYDAILILANGMVAQPQFRKPVVSACKHTLKAIMVNKNPDGSFADRQLDNISYWATKASAYIANQGSLWDTYARLMTVAMCMEVVNGQECRPVSNERHLFEIWHSGQGWEDGKSQSLEICQKKLFLHSTDTADASRKIKTTKPTYKISVVIPAYNIAEYIGRAIESALAQTYPVEEIIVVDDGSTDNTADIIKQYTNSSKIHYIHQPNSGVSAACNTGIKAARGNWIAFLDGDDQWLPEKLALQIELLQRNPELVWCICNSIYKPFGEPRGREFLAFDKGERLLAGKEYFESFIQAATYHVGWNRCTMLVKRDVLLEVGAFTDALTSAEELDLWLRVAYRWPQIGYVNRPLVTYIWNRPGSLAARPALQRLEIVCNVLDKHLKLSRQYGKYDEVKTLIARMIRDRLYNMYRQKQFNELRQLMARYKHIIPAGLKAKMQFKTTCPRLAKLFFTTLGVIRRMFNH